MKDTITPSVTATQVCVILGISRGTLQALVDTGRLKEDRVGDLVRYTHEAIAECIIALAEGGLYDDAGHFREAGSGVDLDEGGSGAVVPGAEGAGGGRSPALPREAPAGEVRVRQAEGDLGGRAAAQDDEDPAPHVLPEAQGVDDRVSTRDADLIRWLENPDMTIGAALRREVAARLRQLLNPCAGTKETT